MSAIPQIIVLDTCVLISNVLRRVLLHLADQACFQPAWSTIIGDEWRRNAARIWEVEPESIAQQWEELQAMYPAADQGDVASFKEGLAYSDPKDWHVIAAARAALARRPDRSVVVLTRNLRDFRRSELRRFGLGLMEPDQLLVQCWKHNPEQVRAAFQLVPQDLIAAGREPDSLEVIMKRERLFRLNKLYD